MTLNKEADRGVLHSPIILQCS